MNPLIKKNSDFLLIIMKIMDLFIIISSGCLCFFMLEPIKSFTPYQGFMPENYLTIIILGGIFSAWWFPAFNVYKSWRASSIFTEITALLTSWVCSSLGLLIFIFFTKTATDFSRHWFLLWFGFTFIALMLVRLITRASLHFLRQKGFNQRHIIIVGEGDLSQQVIKKIEQSAWMGLQVQGYFSDIDKQTSHNYPLLGDINDLFSYVEQHNIDQVWITLPLKAMEKIEAICQKLHSVVVEVKLVPDIASLRLLNYSSTYLDGMPIINISISAMTLSNRVAKWLEDKILALLILILISPLLFIIALCIKITSKGPVFYRQERLSVHGKKFNMLKFRSMPMDSDKDIVWGNANHKQKTKIGQFLRTSSLDELPQFINVLKGDMSIVGPRPERTVFVDQFKYEIDNYMQKHLVKAGITGWAQVNGWRGDSCLKTRLDYDLFYIENWSLGFDLKIILMTVYKGFNQGDK